MAHMNTLLSPRGQTVVPSKIRRKHALRGNSRLAWFDDGTSIRVVPLGAGTGKFGRGLAKGLGLSKKLLAVRSHDRSREKRARPA